MRGLLEVWQLALATLLCWDAVTTDCHGQPELLSGYAVVTASAVVVGWTPPTDEIPYPQPIYASGPGPVVPNVPPSPGRPCATLTDDPPVGGVYYYRPEAMDLAGNRSDDPCP